MAAGRTFGHREFESAIAQQCADDGGETVVLAAVDPLRNAFADRRLKCVQLAFRFAARRGFGGQAQMNTVAFGVRRERRIGRMGQVAERLFGVRLADPHQL